MREKRESLSIIHELCSPGLLKTMIRLSLALLISLLASQASGQTVARVSPLGRGEKLGLNPETKSRNDQVLAARAIVALRRLDDDVLVYGSLGEFEDQGKLARVSFENFRDHLRDVTAEVEPLIARMSETELKAQISNALASYRDGAFWWGKIYQPRVVSVSALASELSRTSSDAAFLSTIPYTVAINWRQARKHLSQAERETGRERGPGSR
jgi:hypothetical protein